MAELNQDNADLSVFTFKEGLLSPVAHDLKLKVGRWSARLEAVSAGVVSLHATFDAASLTVDGVMRDQRLHRDVLGARDADKIARTIRDEVLQPARNPTITWRGEARLAEDGTGSVAGELTLAGRTRRVTSRVRREAGGEDVWVIETTVTQPDFGIKPYSAMLGTLKIKPDVVVSLRVADRLVAPLFVS